jgi:hypothetical protein
MAEKTFEMFVARERTRLNGEREALLTQQQELEQKLEAVNRELSAIDAYEAAKSGKVVKSARAVAAGRTRTRLISQGRRGSKRDELLKLIQESEGLSRGEILEKMGLKGNKSGEMSVSNALTALTKGNQVRRDENRKYVAG